MTQGRFDEAKDVLEKDIQTNPSEISNLLLLSAILIINNQLFEAKEKAILAQTINPAMV
jgi:hypothetical protein